MAICRDKRCIDFFSKLQNQTNQLQRKQSGPGGVAVRSGGKSEGQLVNVNINSKARSCPVASIRGPQGHKFCENLNASQNMFLKSVTPVTFHPDMSLLNRLACWNMAVITVARETTEDASLGGESKANGQPIRTLKKLTVPRRKIRVKRARLVKEKAKVSNIGDIPTRKIRVELLRKLKHSID